LPGWGWGWGGCCCCCWWRQENKTADTIEAIKSYDAAAMPMQSKSIEGGWDPSPSQSWSRSSWGTDLDNDKRFWLRLYNFNRWENGFNFNCTTCSSFDSLYTLYMYVCMSAHTHLFIHESCLLSLLIQLSSSWRTLWRYDWSQFESRKAERAKGIKREGLTNDWKFLKIGEIVVLALLQWTIYFNNTADLHARCSFQVPLNNFTNKIELNFRFDCVPAIRKLIVRFFSISIFSAIFIF